MKPIETSSCCTPQDTAAQAARVIRKSCAPVVEDTKNLDLAGVVTERDVCCHVAANDLRASDVKWKRSCGLCRPAVAREPLEQVRLKLQEHGAASLPDVSKAGRCYGTVSIDHLDGPSKNKRQT